MAVWGFSVFHNAGFVLTLPTMSQAQAASTIDERQQYLDLARQDAKAEGLDPDIFVKADHTRSDFNPDALSMLALRVIAQFMPATAKGLGVQSWNPVNALHSCGGADESLRQAISRRLCKSVGNL